jgi:hypothetical protein
VNKTIIHFIFPLIVIAVLATALFGFSMMSEPGHMMVGCFGSVPGAACSMLSPIEHFMAHLNAFQSISTAVVQLSLLLAAALLFILAILFFDIGQLGSLSGDFAVRQFTGFRPPQRLQFMQWIALHEKRDPSFAAAMNA